MSKYVPDISTRRWVIISPQRLGRPAGTKAKCPFCPGHEAETPPEVLRFGDGEADKHGWKVRVIPNKFPITDIHEVIIHTPDHDKDIESLDAPHVELILKAYKMRYNFYRKKGQVLIFGNHGEHAGASLAHPHSQLVVIPSQINLETLLREPLANRVKETKYFHVYCPDFSQWPFEVWISFKKDDTVFGDIVDEEITDLAQILIETLKRLRHIYQRHQISSIPFGYNYYLYHKENWYVRIIPRFIHRAGFEHGTGLSVNIIDPFNASLELRGESEQMTSVLRKLKSKI